MTISCGNKHDNLARAKALLGEAPFVPFCGISDAQISPLFSEKTMQLWHKASGWDRSDLQGLRLCLTKLEKRVQKDILAHEFSLNEEQQHFLSKVGNKKLMVRSSTDHEDSKESVGAGRYKSIAGVTATEEGIKKALASVVSFYFNAEAMMHTRGKEGCLKWPLCSVLLMEQVEMDASGVMMTHQQGWSPLTEGRVTHIAATWGFGGGVVSGKVPSDEWMITDELTYRAIREKPFCHVASSEEEAEQRANPLDLRLLPSMSEKQLQELQDYGRRLEEVFHTPLDIEFVVKNGILTIVQVRPAVAKIISHPNFLDPSCFSQWRNIVQAEPFLPGASQVVTLHHDQICAASNIEEANNNFDSSKNRAVVIFNKPECRNSHGEVNLNDQQIPCIIISEKQWFELSWILRENKSLKLNLCSQTGMMVISSDTLPVRQGLFLHPARFAFSVDSTDRSMQSESNNHPLITELSEQLAGTPEMIQARIEKIQVLVDSIFSQIAKRKGNVSILQHTSEKVYRMAQDILRAMQKSSREGHLTTLALHTAMLRQLVNQKNPSVLGSHSIAGIETATNLPDYLERFLETHANQEDLVNLGLFATRAFDQTTQRHWLVFLENHQDLPSTSWESLRAHLTLLNEMGMLGTWLAFYFKEQIPTFEVLSQSLKWKAPFFSHCQRFEQSFRQLRSDLESATSEEELVGAWNTLQKEGEAFIAKKTFSSTRDPLEEMMLSKLLIDLIDLWDFSVKVVVTSKMYSEDVKKTEMFRQRIHVFADWGTRLCETSLTKFPFMPEVQKILYQIREYECSCITSFDPFFNVQQWIAPGGYGKGSKIKNEDQKLTIVHKNVLQLAMPPLSSEIKPCIPLELAEATKSFQEQIGENYVKRFGNEKGSFFFLTDTYAKVKINVPLNLHSFVMEISQKKGSHQLDLRANWRSSDNDRSHYITFLQTVASMTGIILKGYEKRTSDLQVDFMIQDKKQRDLIFLAIKLIFADIWTREQTPLLSLTEIMLQFKGMEDTEESFTIAQDEVITYLLQRYLKGEDLPNFIDKHDLNLYFTRNPLLEEVSAKVVQELLEMSKISLIAKPAHQRLLPFVLPSLSEAKRHEVIWKDLNAHQRIDLRLIAKQTGFEIFDRLIAENPVKAMQYFNRYKGQFDRPISPSEKELTAHFKNLMSSFLKECVEKDTNTPLDWVQKTHLENLTQEELEKLITRDLHGKRSISLIEYPQTAYPVLKRFLDENLETTQSFILNFFKSNHFVREGEALRSFFGEYFEQNPAVLEFLEREMP